MSVPTVSLAPQTFGWRTSAAMPLATSHEGQAVPAVAEGRRAGGETPLMQAMMATVSVTASDAAQAPAEAPPPDAAEPATPPADNPLPEALQRFSQSLMRVLRDSDGGDAAGPAAQGQSYGQLDGLGQRIARLAERLGGRGDAPAAVVDPLPQPASAAVMEAFTALQQAMGEPPPEGEMARRQALGEFLAKLAQSFGGRDAPLIPTGALLSVRA